LNFFCGRLQPVQQMLDAQGTLLKIRAAVERFLEASFASSSLKVSLILDLTLDGAGLVPLRAPRPPEVAYDLLYKHIFQRPNWLVMPAQIDKQLIEGRQILPALTTSDD
jgi:hypothetical protein